MDYLHLEWETATRYYSLEVSKDMLGHWVMTRLWKSKFAKSGRSQIISSDYIEDVQKMIADTTKRRLQRGYQLCHSGLSGM